MTGSNAFLAETVVMKCVRNSQVVVTVYVTFVSEIIFLHCAVLCTSLRALVVNGSIRVEDNLFANYNECVFYNLMNASFC